MSDVSDFASARTTDRLARLAAQTVFERPVVLEAGAGTGKTAALVARIVAWALGPGWERAAVEEAEALARAGKHDGIQEERVAARCLEGVVAITFTEAAAAEMATRVGETLAGLARDERAPWLADEALPSAPEVCRKRAGALLVALDHLAVSTIHAFCRRLLARSPLEAGLHPSFAVDADESLLGQVVQEAVESAIRHAFGAGVDPDFLFLAGLRIGPQALREALVRLVGAGVSGPALGEDPLAPERIVGLARRTAGAAAALVELVAPRLRGAKKARNAVALAAALPGLADRLRAAEGCTPSGLAELVADGLPENLADHLGKWRKGDLNGEENERLGEVETELRLRAATLDRLLRLIGQLDAELLSHGRRVLAPLLAVVERELRSRGAETFGALLRDARDLLVRHPEVAARERREIRQLLLDEFQDTDAVQCEILRSLALDGPASERPCLFLVGDPKQSIYGWRNADLAAYERFVADVMRAGGKRHVLAVNFRSVPAILDEVTRCVAPVMVRERGVQPAFEPLLPCEAKATSPGFSGAGRAPVEFWVSWAAPGEESAEGEGEGTTTAEANEIEASALARDIRALHDEAGVAWQEIGVLLRAFSDADVYLQALREADVPYAVERDRGYFRRREVIEAAALVRTILDPADHLALVTWLRSASVGVPDAALLPLWDREFPALMTELRGAHDPRLERVRELAASVTASLPPDVPGIERIAGWERAFVAGVEAIAELRAAFETGSAVAFVERLRALTLLEASEAARVLGAYRLANLDRFFRELLSGMEETGRDREAIMRALRRAVAEKHEAEEGRPREAAADAVQVMTIHKSKGLDFAHVYLVQMHKGAAGARPTVADAEELDGTFEVRLFGAPTLGWGEVEERRRRVAEAELVRTLYVAMTRARERLVVAGRWPASPAGKARAGSHVALLRRRTVGLDLAGLQNAAATIGSNHVDAGGVRWVFPALLRKPLARPARREGVPVPGSPEAADDAAALTAHRAVARERMARSVSASASEEAHQVLRELLAEEHGEEEPTIARLTLPVTRGAATAAGSAVHRALELFDLRADATEELSRQRERLEGYLAGLCAPSDHGGVLHRAEAVLDRFASSPLKARLAEVAPHVVARELPVLLPPDGRPDGPVGFVSGSIDLVYRDPADGALVIVDFKTDEVEGDDAVARRASAYSWQGAVYARALQEALGLSRPPRFELWFLWPGVIEAIGESP